MPPIALAAAAALAASLPVSAAAPATIAGMKWHHRILLVAAPVPGDHALLEQRRILAVWQQGAADRDIALVEIVGGHVTGSGDDAAALRRHWKLPTPRFAVVLIGKDGHEAMRRDAPIPAAALQGTIDAMPMRRAGQR
ncbi:protein of unknown function [Sphingomonas gellani]|uniref:DUF4174 domain-containing protein n=1 Tax=Sphingomonas gellani TaxID=1166340 RepID=A0A1H8AND0_9SPHN|nr:DUF4174 domain-containing protein [Sphingomonas gellani]SEM72250.1 protein of unknown function [Sphingomonas gellani]